MMQVTPSQLLLLAAEFIKAKLNLLVQGKPGIGKTEIVAQACQLVQADHLISQPAVEDPTVPAGLPWLDKAADHATFKPFGNLYKAMKAVKLTCWNLEDLGQAAPAVQAGYMQLLLAKEVNGHKLPDVVTFIATTNRRTDRAGVTGILEPVKSRFAAIVELVTNLDEWCQWAVTKPYIPPEMIAFLRFRESDNFLDQFTPSADLTNCPLPRTWAHVGKILTYTKLPQEVEAAAVAGAVGDKAATEFLGFRRMFKQLPSLEAILMNPEKANIPTELSVLFAVSSGLANLANEQNFNSVAKYVQRMVDAGRGDFGALLVNDAARRTPSVQTTPGFVRLMAGELGKMVAARAA